MFLVLSVWFRLRAFFPPLNIWINILTGTQRGSAGRGGSKCWYCSKASYILVCNTPAQHSSLMLTIPALADAAVCVYRDTTRISNTTGNSTVWVEWQEGSSGSQKWFHKSIRKDRFHIFTVCWEGREKWQWLSIPYSDFGFLFLWDISHEGE